MSWASVTWKALQRLRSEDLPNCRSPLMAVLSEALSRYSSRPNAIDAVSEYRTQPIRALPAPI